MKVQQSLYIDGAWRRTAEALEVYSPWSGDLIGQAGVATAEDISDATAAAERALRRDDFPAHARSGVLRAAEMLLRERSEQFAESICGETGKPIKMARAEVVRALDTISLSADAARAITGDAIGMDTVASGTGMLAFEITEPIGVVAAITPFNFPLNLAMHKVAPAIAAGCPVVWKPSERTPLTAGLLTQLFHDAGLPNGMVNLLSGDPAEIVDGFIHDARIELISFTGSAAVGWDIKARSPMKRHVLELGSNAAAYVDARADIGKAVSQIAPAAFGFAGQACISTQRVYAHRDIAKEFRAALIDAAQALRVGNPADEDTDVGPMIATEARDRVAGWIASAVDAGADLDYGGSVTNGVLPPTVVVDPPDDAEVVRHEVFAPLVVVKVVDDVDDAVRHVNASDFALNTSIYTADLDVALGLVRRIQSGTVLVNTPTNYRAEHMPYGGVKKSGQGREGVSYAVEDMTHRKLVLLNT